MTKKIIYPAGKIFMNVTATPHDTGLKRGYKKKKKKKTQLTNK